MATDRKNFFVLAVIFSKIRSLTEIVTVNSKYTRPLTFGANLELEIFLFALFFKETTFIFSTLNNFFSLLFKYSKHSKTNQIILMTKIIFQKIVSIFDELFITNSFLNQKF
jgi:hypothetical protein